MNQEYSSEFKFFSFFKLERSIDIFRPHPEDFLSQYAPDRISMLKRILHKLGFSFKGEFIADLLMPGNVGGYFSPGKNILAINPYLLLSGTEEEIAHVLYHEGLHAGIFTNGTQLMEEVVVETMTKKKIEDLYGKSTFKTGYDSLVEDASKFFGDLSFDDMKEMVEDEEDQSSFDKFMSLAVVNPSIRNQKIEDLKWNSIQNNLKQKWGMLKELFPRTINSIAKNNKGLHEAAKMEAHQYKLEGLLENTARDIMANHQDLLIEIFLEVTQNGEKSLDSEEIISLLMKDGYGYLYDMDPGTMKKMIQLFTSQVTILRFQEKEIIADNIALMAV